MILEKCSYSRSKQFYSAQIILTFSTPLVVDVFVLSCDTMWAEYEDIMSDKLLYLRQSTWRYNPE